MSSITNFKVPNIGRCGVREGRFNDIKLNSVRIGQCWCIVRRISCTTAVVCTPQIENRAKYYTKEDDSVFHPYKIEAPRAWKSEYFASCTGNVDRKIAQVAHAPVYFSVLSVCSIIVYIHIESGYLYGMLTRALRFCWIAEDLEAFQSWIHCLNSISSWICRRRAHRKAISSFLILQRMEFLRCQ